MNTYRVTDPQTGQTLRLEGDSPPTEQELNDIFSQTRPAPTSLGGMVGGGPIGGAIDFLTGGVQKIPGAIQQSRQSMQQTAPQSLGEALNPLHALSSFGSMMKPLAEPAVETVLDIQGIKGIPGLLRGGVGLLGKGAGAIGTGIKEIPHLAEDISPTKAWKAIIDLSTGVKDTISHLDLADYLKQQILYKNKEIPGEFIDQAKTKIDNTVAGMVKKFYPSITKGIDKGIPLNMSDLINERATMVYDPANMHWEPKLVNAMKREMGNIAKGAEEKLAPALRRYGTAKDVQEKAPEVIKALAKAIGLGSAAGLGFEIFGKK